MVTVSKADAPLSVTHPAHPGHVLELVATDGAVFGCDGCRQYGADERKYRCEPCDFDLHLCCATLGPHLTHPLLEGCTFTFFDRPPNVPGYVGRFCDACGDPVLGFMFYDGERQLDLHPQCASLPEHVVEEDCVVDLCKELPAHGNCGLCQQGKTDGHRGRFWCYRQTDSSDGESEYVHVACLREACYSRSQVVKVSAPTTEEVGTLESAPAPVRRSGRFLRFCKVTFAVVRLTVAVATLDPVGIVTAVAGL